MTAAGRATGRATPTVASRRSDQQRSAPRALIRAVAATEPANEPSAADAVKKEEAGDATSADERLIPFVSAYVDDVDLGTRRIRVDWGLDY